MNNKQIKILKRNICSHGREYEMFVAAEEAAELIQALSKIKRNAFIGEYAENLIEEIADVLVIIRELMIMFDITDADVEKNIDFKIQRINDRLNGN